MRGSTELNVPHGAEPELLLRIGRELALSCPYTHLGHGMEVELSDSDPRLHAMKLGIASVYDHRYTSAMQTDILRRARRELVAYGILSSSEVSRTSI